LRVPFSLLPYSILPTSLSSSHKCRLIAVGPGDDNEFYSLWGARADS
jgi:hypothetical protein